LAASHIAAIKLLDYRPGHGCRRRIAVQSVLDEHSHGDTWRPVRHPGNEERVVA
jgi:hypothetical protein